MPRHPSLHPSYAISCMQSFVPNITACVLKKPTGTGYAISYAFIDSATPATWPKQKSLSF